MRTAITVAKRHSNSKWVTLAGPEVEITTQLAEAKKLAGHREHKDFSDLEVWSSDGGRQRRLKFSKPPTKDPEKPK